MRVGSLFSGIGGFDLGLERAGHSTVWQCELDPFCQRVLARHWPGVERVGDVRTVGDPESKSAGRRAGLRAGAAAHAGIHPESGGAIPAVDLLVGGFPCQDVSVAGKRAGLAGARSSLFWEFLRVARLLRPRWLLLENVPGLLTSHGGRDFAAVLGGLAECGYGWAYRVLDSQHFGVAQRRRRVFIVGHRGGECPPSVLFEPARRGGHPAPGREAGTGLAPCLESGTNRTGGTRPPGTTVDTAESPGDPCHPLASGAHPPAIAMNLRGSHDERGGPPQGARVTFSDQASLRAARGGSSRSYLTLLQAEPAHATHPPSLVRRLTATECELLQGFPPGWTCLCGVTPYTTATCRCPDSPRYRALGNAVTVNVAFWIGRRLAALEDA